MEFLKSNRYYLKNTIYIFICSIILIKLLLLLWSAHPYDFWTFVTTIQKNTLYNYNLFEYWNKGNLLMIIWYPLYSLYLFILNLFSAHGDNLLFLHFIFKIPFLFIDLLSGYLIFKIINIFKNDSKLALIGFFFWFLNPLIFYSYGIHGHYELLVPFAFIIILYGLLKESPIITSIGFLIGITTKYFFIIFLPFVVLYLLSQKKYRLLLKSSIVLFLGLIISYIHFFFDPSLLFQTLKSILNLSQSNAPIGFDIITLSSTNLVSAINYIFNPQTPINNLNHPFLFELANKGLIIVAFFLICHFIYRLFNIFYFKNLYTFQKLFYDLFFSLCYFLIFFTNFQAHYLIWLIPFFIIYLFFNLDLRILFIFIAYTVIGFIYAFRGELGTFTFFLDIINANAVKLLSLTSKYFQVVYREGSMLIFLLITTIISLLIPIKNKISCEIHAKKHLIFYLLFIIIIWFLILIPYIQVINVYFKQNTNFTDLAYSRGGQLNRGTISAEYEISNISKNKISFNNTNNAGSLVIQEVKKLKTIDQEKFEVYVLIGNKINFSTIKNELINNYFNDCLITESQFKPDILIQNNVLNGFKVPIICLRDADNYIYLKQSENLTTNTSISLYIKNIKVDYLFLDRNKIYFMAAIGTIYFVIMMFLSIVFIKKITKK